MPPAPITLTNSKKPRRSPALRVIWAYLRHGYTAICEGRHVKVVCGWQAPHRIRVECAYFPLNDDGAHRSGEVRRGRLPADRCRAQRRHASGVGDRHAVAQLSFLGAVAAFRECASSNDAVSPVSQSTRATSTPSVSSSRYSSCGTMPALAYANGWPVGCTCFRVYFDGSAAAGRRLINSSQPPA